MMYIGLFYYGPANESLHTVTNPNEDINVVIEDLKKLSVDIQGCPYDDLVVRGYFGDDTGIVKVIGNGNWNYGFVSCIKS